MRDERRCPIRRVLLVLGIAALVAAILTLEAAPVFAASDNASCVGQLVGNPAIHQGSFLNPLTGQPTTFGEAVSGFAQNPGEVPPGAIAGELPGGFSHPGQLPSLVAKLHGSCP